MIRILRPSLDDLGSDTVLRGIIAPESLEELKNDFYQREKLPASSRRDINYALESATQLPDIELGMRGDRFQIGGEGDSQFITLLDPVYIIDGRQRTETLKDYLQQNPGAKTHLGAIVHFNTTPEWERARFHVLNTSRVKVSPSILLRNIKDDSPALATLYGLSKTDPDFPLHNRVCWSQNMGRHELISALAYTRVTLRLHAHLAPARHFGSAREVVGIANRVADRIGIPLLRTNAQTLWKLIDELWGIKALTRKTDVTWLKAGFLQVLVDILSAHVDFWVQPDETRLQVGYELKNKLKKFPVFDPEVMRLAGASGQAIDVLHILMVQHINSGKRTKRLIPRNVRATMPPIYDEEEDSDDEDAA